MTDDSTLEILASEDAGDYEELDDAGDRSVLLPPPKPQGGEIYAYLKIQSRWTFHKIDVDPWPSRLHAHHSYLPLKLCAITGNVYNIHTRKRTQRLRPTELARIHAELHASKDFMERASALIPAKAARR